jgi:hypothetical protein
MLAGEVIDSTSVNDSMQCRRMTSAGESEVGSIAVIMWDPRNDATSPRRGTLAPPRRSFYVEMAVTVTNTGHTVTFTVHAAQLGFYDRQLRYVVEPGEIEVHIGTSVAELHLAGTFTITTSDGAVEVDKVFDPQARISDPDDASDT